MTQLTVGTKVRVTHSANKYLTTGHTYLVTKCEGRLFHVVSNPGNDILCLYPRCNHAEWEIVE